MSGTRVDSSGRVQPIESRNLAIPAECLLCKRIGNSPDEIFADLRVELGFYGDCYLCQDCCREIASFVLSVPPELYEAIKAENIIIGEHSKVLWEKNLYLRSLLNARIDSVGSPESSGDGSTGIPLFETEPDTTFIDSVLNSDKSVLNESGSRH